MDYGGPSIAWNGRDYAMAYVTPKLEPAIMRISRAGTASTPIKLASSEERDTYQTSITTDGTNFFVAWRTVGQYTGCFPPCTPKESIRALRLRPDFTAIDSPELVLAEGEMALAGSAWWRGKYIVYWSTSRGSSGREVPASGPPAPLASDLYLPDTDRFNPTRIRVLASQQGLVLWTESGPHPALFFSWNPFYGVPEAAPRFARREFSRCLTAASACWATRSSRRSRITARGG